MKKATWIYQQAVEWLWYALVALLPVTSFPLVAKLSRSDNVAPASGLFLILLAIFWLMPYLFKKGTLPAQTKPFIFFLFAAIVSTGLSFFINHSGYKDVSVLQSITKGTVTLLIGCGFYLLVSAYLRDEKIIRNTFRCINYSGIVFLIWCGAQAVFWYWTHDYPGWMKQIQAFLSTGVLFDNRITGLALEPSWLAHQLNMLYLPFWLSATVVGYSAHETRLIKISFENVLLVGGIGALVLSFSRAGWAVFLLMLAYLFIRLNMRLIKWLKTRLFEKKKKNQIAQVAFTIVLVIVLIGVYLGGLFGVAVVSSKVDTRMADLFKFSGSIDNPILRYANMLKFGERVTYWIAGWQTFNDHPFLGVGLGNAGFFMIEKLPSFAWTMVEVQKLVYHTSALLNVKSLWFRLLAETGIVGFILFVTWLYLTLVSARTLFRKTNKMARTIGLMGFFMLIGLVLEGINIDSFAMPYLWITAGIVAAAACMFSRKEKNGGSDLVKNHDM